MSNLAQEIVLISALKPSISDLIIGPSIHRLFIHNKKIPSTPITGLSSARLQSLPFG